MIERYPEGTAAIPYPHKVFRWKTGNLTLRVEAPDSTYPAPRLEGWTYFWVTRLGPGRTEFTYRPAKGRAP